MDTQNESDALKIASMEPNDGGSNTSLRGMHWHAGDVNSVGNRMDGSEGQADVLRGQMDALSMLKQKW